jgi:NAD(P)-dependent dehydrogenase (short-subunit alcohol dehydrogenase family)
MRREIAAVRWFEMDVAKLNNRDNSNIGLFTALGVSLAALYAGSRLLAKNSGRDPVDFRNKVILISGGSRGLGLAMAKEFGHQGSRLALCARDAEELQNARELLTKEGIEVDTFTCDVTKKSEVEALIGQVINRFGHIDILVNNAGLISVAPLDSLEERDFEKAMDLMFWGPFHMTMAVLPHMKKLAGAQIINIASVGGRVSVPHLIPYSCAKFALVGLSNGLAAELQSRNIYVLTVCPGLMRTGSYLRAEFKGKVENEFGWFSVLGNIPGFSVAADYAARQIRHAAERRKHSLIISLPAKILIAADAIVPELTQTILGTVNSVLPGPGPKSSASGESMNPKFGRVFQMLTTLGRQAARKLNESPA